MDARYFPRARPCEQPGTWVTLLTGDMGNTFPVLFRSAAAAPVDPVARTSRYSFPSPDLLRLRSQVDLSPPGGLRDSRISSSSLLAGLHQLTLDDSAGTEKLSDDL